MIDTFSGLTCPSRWAAASRGRIGSSASPSIEVRGPTASAERTRRTASALDRLSVEVSTRRIVPWHSAVGSSRRCPSTMIW